MNKKRPENEYTPISLDLKVKGDKFLYYKRRFEIIENTIKVFPFWNNTAIWIFLAFTLFTLGFISFLIVKTYAGFSANINLLLFQNSIGDINKQYIYLYFLIPCVNFIVTFFIGYRLYSSRRQLSYTLILANVICTSMFLIGLVKIIQMHFIPIS
jgi:hypothetical protein